MGIQFKNVSHEYLSIGRSDNAISNINLNIEKEGEFIAILGHTGAGKSTLVQHMNALMYPTSGIVTVFGQDLPPKKRERVNHLRRKVGLVFQFPEYQLFENTIIEDISFGPKNFKETKEHALENAKKAAKQVGLDESMYDKSPFRISGGQMRRVAVAGILAMDPSILVLDEPTRGLDPRGRDEMMEIFNNIHENENKTIVLISHDMDIVSKYAKRIIVLKEGKIVFDGCKEDLFNHKDFDSFNLDLPTPLKMMKYLSEKLNIEYKELYTLEELTSYLEEVKL
ncbi:energy-coupling factor transporter ATPase [Haploplasma modicum]|uniref:energy-coupling factor transporter ATPase n=1 Tax=Haploplasma modicum TaxID=2150 RepID=UPI00138AD796|nr:energy-coupling factor transporter ATPase [Haploplasma modicum]